MTETRFYLFTNPEDLVKKAARYFFRRDDETPFARSETKVFTRLVEKAFANGAALVKEANMYLLSKRALWDASHGEELGQPIETFEYLAEASGNRIVSALVGEYDSDSRALCESVLDKFFRTLYLPPTLETETEETEVPEVDGDANGT